MKRKLQLKGFTLIELMVIIAIMGILVSAGSQVNFNEITDDNKLLIFNNKIISHFEGIRNNTLLGRGVDLDIGVPDSWKITYNTSGSGTIIPSYLSGGTWTNYSGSILMVPELYSISQINCLDIAGGIINPGVVNAEVHIEGNKFTLLGDCGINSRKLEFTTKFRNDSAVIEINTLNGLIEIQ